YARVDAWAPAEPIRRGEGVKDGSYGFGVGDGTSYACLHATAAAAFWWRLKGAEIQQTYGQSWRRVEAFRHLLLQKRTPTAPDQDAELRFSQSELRHLEENSNRGRLVNCERLVRSALPDPNLLEKRMDRAADDVA
ncbi:MAG: hypothetical protein AAFY02_13560, partial [Pseudomonadota bacterium]